MRVQRSQQGGKRRTLSEEKSTHSRADSAQAQGSGGQACLRDFRYGSPGEPGISEAAFHRWKNRYGSMQTDSMKRLKDLEKENVRLKKIVADQAVDISILKEVSRGNF